MIYQSPQDYDHLEEYDYYEIKVAIDANLELKTQITRLYAFTLSLVLWSPTFYSGSSNRSYTDSPHHIYQATVDSKTVVISNLLPFLFS
jgi:hypothetical protein